MNLPEPRKDGVCCECGRRDAVTKDGRFCRPCLKSLVAKLSPGWTGRSNRTSDQQQARETEPSPWQETAVRAMEDA